MVLPQIMVAPNGARMQKTDHSAVPITTEEIVACARECFAAGAQSIHAHIRDKDGTHLLDGSGYRALVNALHSAVPELAVQITTEAAGRYAPDRQMQVALDSGANHVSVSVREICRATTSDVTTFLDRCAAQNITLQYILYNVDDATRLESILPNGALRSPALQLLFVLGRYGQQDAKPSDLDPFTDWMAHHDLDPDWAVCAFGKDEVRCLLSAVQKGGKCRTGFENSIHLADGTIAPNNAAKVSDLRVRLALGGKM